MTQFSSENLSVVTKKSAGAHANNGGFHQPLVLQLGAL